MTDHLELPLRYREQLEELLREHVPGVEVWAYGSRVNGRGHEGSDLDLVLRSPTLEPLDGGFYDLLEAIEKSRIPILVQAHDWAKLPESFHREIEKDYVVVQKGAKEGSASVDGEWQEVKLGDICDFHRGSVFKLYYQGQSVGDYPFIKVSDMNIPANGVYIHEANNWVTKRVADVIGAKPLSVGTVVFAKIGEALKRNRLRMVVQPTIVDNNMMGATPKTNIVDHRFLFYGMQQFDFGEVAFGTALPYLTVSSLTELPFDLPPILEQRAIAHVLGTLDDKIELNRRMNETLETMARAIFRDWFVNFGPVRAKMEGREPYLPPELWSLFPDRLVDSELGQIPEGWEVRRLGEFGKVITGKTPSTRNLRYYGGDVPFLKIPDMHGLIYVVKTTTTLSEEGARSQPQNALPSGSISVSCIATPGLVVLNHKETHTNQQINSIVPYENWLSKYLYWSCRSLSAEIMTGGSGGSIFGNMNKSTFSGLVILCPSDEAVIAFDNLVSPLHDRILVNSKEIENIAVLRDALLPKLVSGDIRA